MHSFAIMLVRLLLIPALLFGIGLAPLGVDSVPSVIAGDEDDDDGGEDENYDDEDEDEDDRGRNDKDKDKDKKDRIDAGSGADYRVDVDCDYDEDEDASTCQFTPQTSEGAKKVTHLTVPVEYVCGDVEGGEADFADPDPNTRVVGYTTRGGESDLSLVIQGEVTVRYNALYWVKAEGSIFPAQGDGLSCAGSDEFTVATLTPETADDAVTPQPTSLATSVPVVSEISDTTGAIVVQAFGCPISEPTAEYDWFTECERASAGLRFRVTPLEDESKVGKTGSTDESGESRFGILSPGTYQLTQVEGNWCHAKSDGVDAEGNVIVRAGQRTTVWVFACQDDAASPTPPS